MQEHSRICLQLHALSRYRKDKFHPCPWLTEDQHAMHAGMH